MDKKHPSSKRYPPDFKERACRPGHRVAAEDPGDRTVISQVARQLGIRTETLRLWVKQATSTPARAPV